MRSLLAAFFASCHLINSARAQSFVEQHGALRVEGNKASDSHGRPITLRGMALYWSQWKTAFYNDQCLKWLRDDWKCTVVRAAIDLGIYVIIDFHETGNANDHLSQAKKSFGDISKEFVRFHG